MVNEAGVIETKSGWVDLARKAIISPIPAEKVAEGDDNARLNMVKAISASGVRFDDPSWSHMVAISEDSLPNTMRFILENGGDAYINRRGEFSGGTDLHYAALHNHDKVVDVLLEKGADPTIRANNGKTAAQWAGGYGYTELSNKLMAEEKIWNERQGRSDQPSQTFGGDYSVGGFANPSVTYVTNTGAAYLAGGLAGTEEPYVTQSYFGGGIPGSKAGRTR